MLPLVGLRNRFEDVVEGGEQLRLVVLFAQEDAETPAASEQVAARCVLATGVAGARVAATGPSRSTLGT